MILDYVHRAEVYQSVCPNLVEAIKFAETLKDAEVGRYDFGDCFVLVQEMETKHAAEKDFELHRKYLDVHVVLEGEELLGYEDITNFKPKEEFNEEKDIQMLIGDGQYVTIKPGMFCVVFPHDAHKPGCCVTTPAKLRKFVIKVPAEGK